MLVNNFKILLDFDTSKVFTNTNGDLITKSDPDSSYGHSVGQILVPFNYQLTTSLNNMKSECTNYVYSTSGLSESSYTNRMLENNGNGLTLFVGEGDTAVTANDYSLSSPLNLEVINSACYHNANNTITTVRTFRNDLEVAKTIKEVGLYIFKATSTGYKTYPVMIGRRILTTPVTLAPTDCYTFTYTIQFSTPTFTEA